MYWTFWYIHCVWIKTVDYKITCYNLTKTCQIRLKFKTCERRVAMMWVKPPATTWHRETTGQIWLNGHSQIKWLETTGAMSLNRLEWLTFRGESSSQQENTINFKPSCMAITINQRWLVTITRLPGTDYIYPRKCNNINVFR